MEQVQTWADDPAGIRTAIENEAARFATVVEGYALEVAATVASWQTGTPVGEAGS